MSDDVTARKIHARAEARAARCALDDAVCRMAAEVVADVLLALPELTEARMVMAYGATPEEIDPGVAVSRLRERGVAIALPRIEEAGVLGVHLVRDDAELVTGVFGLREPSADAPRVELADIDVVIVPGVAFDEHGRRLGYGGGYYDRLLPKLRPDCVRIGIAYDEQVIAEVPAHGHDERVQLLVTPSRVVHTGA